MIDLLARSASEGTMFGIDPRWRFGLVMISLDRVILSAFLLSKEYTVIGTKVFKNRLSTVYSRTKLCLDLTFGHCSGVLRAKATLSSAI